MKEETGKEDEANRLVEMDSGKWSNPDRGFMCSDVSGHSLSGRLEQHQFLYRL